MNMRTAIVVSGLFAIGLGGCPGFGRDWKSVDEAACPELGGNASSASFAADARASATIGAFVEAAGDLSTLAFRIEDEVTSACLRMGRDLGLSDADMAPKNGDGGKVAGACNAVSAKIDTILQAGVSASVKATYTPPQCQVDANAQASCDGRCNVNVDPGYVVAHCEPGHLSGKCEGTCSGQCEGTCSGDCAGKCAATGADGKCAGKCEGSCHGRCDATCHAKCEGEWKAPHCDVAVKGPSADAHCEGSCKAHAEVTAACTEPKVAVTSTVNAGEMPKLIATLTANLPALIKAEIAYGKRLAGDIEVLVKTGADLPSAIGQAGAKAVACMSAAADATVHAQASIHVSVEASASISGKAHASGG